MLRPAIRQLISQLSFHLSSNKRQTNSQGHICQSIFISCYMTLLLLKVPFLFLLLTTCKANRVTFSVHIVIKYRFIFFMQTTGAILLSTLYCIFV